MTYLALYRKYRPARFSEVIGQAHIVQVLEATVENKQLAHAYLFVGGRGTGKTSVARIFAAAIGTDPSDLYEIDGASNRGIDEIRELREAVRTLPFVSPYKVYLIDEVHMLTKEAFNALLKTLEEPPNHVIFILATTEAHKIPETIASRCQTFTFRKPGLLELRQAITKVAKKEGVTIEPGAVELLALLGDGSYRDTLGVLEQVMQSAGGKKISSEAVEALFGIPGNWLILNFVLTMVNKDVAGGLSIIKKAAEQSHDLTVFLKLVLRQIRLAMLFLHAPAMRAELSANLTADEVKFLTDVAARPEAVQLPTILRELLAMYDEVGRSPLPELPLELGLLAMIKT